MYRTIRRFVLVLMLTAVSVVSASENAVLRIALDDLPGVDMLPTLIAVERAKQRGLNVTVSYMQSEGMAIQSILNKQADIGMGTPYKKIQETNSPLRMFYQLNMLRFHPVVDSRYYSKWSELDGVVMYSHGEGSGTEALVNMLAKKNQISYSKMLYLPGSGVRANALINGRIHATVVDTERKNMLLALSNSPFKVLPMETINATDEAFFAHSSFIESHREQLLILTEELLYVWRQMNNEPGFVLKHRNLYGLLPKLDEKEISDFFDEMVAEGAFPNDGGVKQAFQSDIDFYGFAGTIKRPSEQQEGQFWDFSILRDIAK